MTMHERLDRARRLFAPPTGALMSAPIAKSLESWPTREQRMRALQAHHLGSLVRKQPGSAGACAAHHRPLREE